MMLLYGARPVFTDTTVTVAHNLIVTDGVDADLPQQPIHSCQLAGESTTLLLPMFDGFLVNNHG